MDGLHNKVAIVTGAARGIGKGIAGCLAKDGCQVIIADVLGEEAEKTAEELRAKGMAAEALQVNLMEESQIEHMVAKVYETYGKIDILVNNAGITVRKPAISIETEEFDRVININLRAYFLASRAAARLMRNQEEKGCIVCISSCNSQHYTSKRSPYNISKAAVNGLAATLAVEWGRLGIRVNAVAPGYVMTDLIQGGIQEGIIDVENIMSVIPIKRFLTVEEIGNAVCFLASDNASGITGQTLFVDGGWSKCGLPKESDMIV